MSTLEPRNFIFKSWHYGRAVKAKDLNSYVQASFGIFPRRFESCWCRFLFWNSFVLFTKPKRKFLDVFIVVMTIKTINFFLIQWLITITLKLFNELLWSLIGDVSGASCLRSLFETVSSLMAVAGGWKHQQENIILLLSL